MTHQQALAALDEEIGHVEAPAAPVQYYPSLEDKILMVTGIIAMTLWFAILVMVSLDPPHRLHKERARIATPCTAEKAR